MSAAKLFLIGLFALTSGCGVSSWVEAPESKYPISLSSGVRDRDGELVAKERKQVVGQFKREYKACSMLWRIISFTGDKDISEDINEQVAKSGGDAVTDLNVESSGTVWNIITFIGIFPDCSNVAISGNIVKVASAPAPAPAAKAKVSAAPKPTPAPTPSVAAATPPAQDPPAATADPAPPADPSATPAPAP